MLQEKPTLDEVADLRKENQKLKETVADLMLRYDIVKKLGVFGIDEKWQTDFRYFNILGWGWYFLRTVLDDDRRFIPHWGLCRSMKAEGVEQTIEAALLKAGLTKYQRPKLLSDYGACYIASELKE